MTEYKDNIEHSNCTEDSEIDLMEIVAKLWKGRKFIRSRTCAYCGIQHAEALLCLSRAGTRDGPADGWKWYEFFGEHDGCEPGQQR